MGTKKCITSSSSDTEASFPDGYCVWQWDGANWQLHSCHCRHGFACDDPNVPGTEHGEFYLEYRRFPCVRP